MPEGPECRRYTESLARRISGRKLCGIDLVSGRFIKKEPSGYKDILRELPLEIVGPGVHGKFIYWILKNEWFIYSTLGMSGAWSADPTDHARIKFVLNDGAVYFNDQRNFGTIKFIRGKYQLLQKLKSLGPDMLGSDVSDELFIERMRKKNKWPIVKALMDQSVVAGVGNYIKADALWLARLSPYQTVIDLTDTRLSNLNQAIKQVMRESYKNGGATIRTYKNFDGTEGQYNREFLVYNQKTDPDGNEVIKELTEDGRTTHWVPSVQI
jgi:formamidopyrimidine-DNA glycosylase